MSILSTRLIELQKQKNVLKKDIAKAIGISTMAYYRYENGERLPNSNIIIALANFFNVSSDYLLGLSEKSNDERKNSSTIASNNNLKQSSISINIKNDNKADIELTSQLQALIHIYKNLDLKNQIKLLSYAFKLEKSKK